MSSNNQQKPDMAWEAAVDVEQAVLGAMLIDNKAVAEAVTILEYKDFYPTKHRLIFKAIKKLFDEGKETDIVTISSLLESKQKLEEAGGRGYITKLVENIGTSANIQSHCELVKRKSQLLQINKLGFEMISLANNSKDPEDIILSVDEKLLNIHENKDKGGKWLKELAAVATESMDGYTQQHSGLRTGFDNLDSYLNPFRAPDLIILAARPTVGKTALAINIGDRLARTNKVVMVASLEMSKVAITERILCSRAGVSGLRLRQGKLSDNEWMKLAQAASEYSSGISQMIIYDRDISTVTKIRAEAKKLQARVGLDILIVDYLQLINSKGETRNEEVGRISRGLKMIAKDLNIPVIALSQLSRKPEDRADSRPILSDLRESGDIEQDADVVLFLYRPIMHKQKPPEKYNITEKNHKRYAEIIIGKQRNGPAGIDIPMWYYDEMTRFHTMDKVHEQENVF